MGSFEGIKGEEFERIETGSRPSNAQEIESYYDETLDQAVDQLKRNGYYRVPDVIDRLDKNKKATKEKLSEVLNVIAGYDWRILATSVRSHEDEKAVSDMIVAWAEEVELAADNKATRAAGEALAQKLDQL
jgi:hypothetical protein